MERTEEISDVQETTLDNTFEWVRAYTGILGNQLADQLTNEGAIYNSEESAYVKELRGFISEILK